MIMNLENVEVAQIKDMLKLIPNNFPVDFEDLIEIWK